MSPSTTISTDIPADVSSTALIAVLHNHDTYIKQTCPQLVSYELESGDASTSCVYRVTDKKPIGQTTYTLTLTNTPEGIDTLVNAKPPVGTLVIKGSWKVQEGKLIENVEIEANMIMKKMVKGNLEKQHAEHHVQLLVMAKAA